jgi:hypothetical protein
VYYFNREYFEGKRCVLSVRTLEYTVSVDDIKPATELFAGSEGDIKATVVNFVLSDDLLDLVDKENIYYRFDGYDAEGNVSRGDFAPLNSKKLTYTLTEPITRCGGRICVYLVITETTDSNTQMELYSFPARMRLNSLPQGGEVGGKEYESFTTLAESAKNSADKAEEILNAAGEKFNQKQNQLIAGPGISIVGDTISVIDGGPLYSSIKDGVFILGQSGTGYIGSIENDVFVLKEG